MINLILHNPEATFIIIFKYGYDYSDYAQTLKNIYIIVFIA